MTEEAQGNYIYWTEYDAEAGLYIAYGKEGNELARGANGLEIVAALHKRNPALCKQRSKVGGVRLNPNGTWRYQNIQGRILLNGVTQAEAESFAREQKKKP